MKNLLEDIFFFTAIAAVIALSIGGFLYGRYLYTKQYYPNITYWDYVLIGDKLMIAPKERLTEFHFSPVPYDGPYQPKEKIEDFKKIGK
jgi:hypothetical protein